MDWLRPVDWFGDCVIDAVTVGIEDAIDWVHRQNERLRLIDLAVWVVPEYPERAATYFQQVVLDELFRIAGPTGVTGVTGPAVCGCGADHSGDFVTEQRRQAEFEEHEEYRQHLAERYKQAEERAAQLLLDVLSPQQRETYEQYNWFEVNSHGRRFRVYYLATSNIVEYSSITGSPLKTWCIVPNGIELPVSDYLVAQKLMLDTDPDMVNRIGVPGKYDPYRFQKFGDRNVGRTEQYRAAIARGQAGAGRRQAQYEQAIFESRVQREFRDALLRQVLVPQFDIPVTDEERSTNTDDGSWYSTPMPIEEPWPSE